MQYTNIKQIVYILYKHKTCTVCTTKCTVYKKVCYTYNKKGDVHPFGKFVLAQLTVYNFHSAEENKEKKK